MNYRNIRLRTIAVPDYDGEKRTGTYSILEVIGMEKMRTIVQAAEGVSVTEDKLYLICFRKGPGLPKKLYVIDIQTDGEIEVIRYENETNERRGRREANGKANDAGGENHHS